MQSKTPWDDCLLLLIHLSFLFVLLCPLTLLQEQFCCHLFFFSFLFSFVSSSVFFFSTFLFGTTIYSRSPSSVLQDTFLFPVVTSLLYFKLSSPTSLTCSLIFSKLSPNWYHSQEVSQVGRHNISAMAWWLPLLETEKAIFFSIATFFPDFLDFFHVP